MGRGLGWMLGGAVILMIAAYPLDLVGQDSAKIQLRYAVAEPGAFRGGVEPAAEDVAEFLDKRRGLLRSTYERRREEFLRPEQVVVRHILFAGPDALGRARAARARLSAGESFADLALELSQDRATREEGGLLGALPRGRLQPAFEEAAFALQEGELSDPVQTDWGVHLILVDAHREALSSFEQISPLLALELLRDEQAAQVAREAAAKMVADLRVKFFSWYTEAESFLAAAHANGLEVSVTDAFSLTDGAVPELAHVEGVFEETSSLSEEHPHAQRVLSDGDAYYVISLVSPTERAAQSAQDGLEATRQ